jgi:uncharacterized lipoprotein YddW (UPF0748 family)
MTHLSLKRSICSKFIPIGAIALSGVFAIPPQSLSQPRRLPSQEMRGVWLTNIDSDVLFTRDRLETGVDRLSKLNFNTVYPTVWSWGYTLYPSQTAKLATGAAQSLYPNFQETGQPIGQENGRDMLQELVTAAKAKQIKVVPWFEFGFMAPVNSELVKRHPDWISRRSNGTSIFVKEGKRLRVWLNPFHPEVQAFLVSMIGEVVTRYDVSGIQLDDHFSLPASLGYDKYTVALYQKEHRGRRPPKNWRNREWTRWRANKLTGLMAKVFRTVKARNSNAVISLSPNPSEFAYNNYLQDWVTWERRGYVGELVLQVYRSDRRQFLSELNRPEVVRAKKHIPVSIGILSGLKNRHTPMPWINQQVGWVRDRKFAGVSFFFFESLWNSKNESSDTRHEGFQKLFPESASRPISGWKSIQSRR